MKRTIFILAFMFIASFAFGHKNNVDYSLFPELSADYRTLSSPSAGGILKINNQEYVRFYPDFSDGSGRKIELLAGSAAGAPVLGTMRITYAFPFGREEMGVYSSGGDGYIFCSRGTGVLGDPFTLIYISKVGNRMERIIPDIGEYHDAEIVDGGDLYVWDSDHIGTYYSLSSNKVVLDKVRTLRAFTQEFKNAGIKNFGIDALEKASKPSYFPTLRFYRMLDIIYGQHLGARIEADIRAIPKGQGMPSGSAYGLQAARTPIARGTPQ